MKKILFTGARSGIAKSTIDRIIDKDFYIYVTVHTSSQLEIVKEKYKENKNVECLKLDVNSKKDRKILDKLDIDILVSNAAIGEGGSMAEINIDKVRKNFETNVFNNYEVIQIVLKNMLKKNKGKIIVISSLAGIYPIKFLGSYCASKASLIKMTECLKKEIALLNKNIKICLVEPGIYKTGFNELMFNNKYDWMNVETLFKSEIETIQNQENFMLNYIARKSNKTISKKIEQAISSNSSKFLYRAPLSQVIAIKLYSLFKE